MPIPSAIPSCLLALLALLVSTAMAPAEAIGRSTFQNAVGACNGALPGFEGSLRKRPLAIANEGTSNAIVSCTLAIDQTQSEGNAIVGVVLINRSAQLVAVSCTFVDGSAPEVPGAILPTYYIENIALSAGQGSSLFWEAADHGLTEFSVLGSASCSLPPGVEIAAMLNVYDDGT